MRNFSDWLAGKNSSPLAKALKSKDGNRRHRELRLEGLEHRELFTVSVTPVYAVTNSWTSGLQAELRLNNQQATSVSQWKLEFDYGANITSIWDAKITSHFGNHYTIAGASWNSNIAASGSVAFSFVASVGTSPTAPINYRLNGEALGGTQTPPTQPPVTIAIGDATLSEGQTANTNAVFTVSMSGAKTTPVTVAYGTVNGTATAGSDYQAVSGTLTFAPGQTSKTISVSVIGDSVVELDEAFYLDLAAANGAQVSKARGTGTIKNDDAPPATSGNFQFKVLNDWGSGFTSQLTMRNAGTTAVNDWRLEFDFAGSITSIWDATIENHVGNHYVIKNAGYNSAIAAGASAAFGFNGSRAGAAVEPTNFLLRSGTGGGTPTNPTTPTDPTTPTNPTTPVTPAVPSAWPAHVYAPYVDMGLYPTYDLVAAARTQGIRYFSLAFIVADSHKAPSWGGYSEYALGTEFDNAVRTQINDVRALGGDVVVSFGGASGQELAQSITDVATLQRAYQSVIDAYGLTHIDFDIEGAASADRASVDRRNQVIAGLQRNAAAAGRALEVSYTLPVLPTGLTNDGLYIVQSAVRSGVNVGIVNVMAMDYGDSAAPNPQGRMGDYAIAAANSLFTQLKSVYGTAKTDAQLWSMLGVTPMIGLNDVTTETFDQQEARELLAFAQQKGIGRLAMWSLNRDQQNSAGQINYVDLKSSSIRQQPFEFSQIFGAFTG